MIEEVGLLDTGAHPSGVWHVWEPYSGWLPGTSLSCTLESYSQLPQFPKDPFYSSHSLTPASLGMPTDSCME